jgi:hypothetical protein
LAADNVGSIVPFLPRNVFDDAATKVMGEAFDAACKTLYDTVQPEKVVQQAIARRIVAAARKGERNAKRLRDAALAGLAGSTRAV